MNSFTIVNLWKKQNRFLWAALASAVLFKFKRIITVLSVKEVTGDKCYTYLEKKLKKK
ncbi:hypothetical protein A5875_000052 [Enterococcus sp. 3H8_DIV0648]|nr:hypothetical protein A5875_000052 [Enterococcus sp. 3H8_DIV0648]